MIERLGPRRRPIDRLRSALPTSSRNPHPELRRCHLPGTCFLTDGRCGCAGEAAAYPPTGDVDVPVRSSVEVDEMRVARWVCEEASGGHEGDGRFPGGAPRGGRQGGGSRGHARRRGIGRCATSLLLLPRSCPMHIRQKFHPGSIFWVKLRGFILYWWVSQIGSSKCGASES
jgi:hypothetical protein